MVLVDIWDLFQDKVFSIPSTVDEETPLFNQYYDKDPTVDLQNADEIRRGNLRNYLQSFSERPSAVVIGEAPGWRGCRFSGVPFTSEAQLCNGELPFKGLQSSSKALPYSEGTATTFWKYMLPHHPRFFAWNCIPFHLYKLDNKFTNRTPRKKEVYGYLWLLSEILSLIKPRQVIAVGRNAEQALTKIGIYYSYVRHPSHGGANDFKKGIENL